MKTSAFVLHTAVMSKPLVYTDKGTGPVLVFVHGFCESKSIWNAFTQTLASSYRVVCIDLPGFGESQLDQDTVSMEWFSDEVHKLMRLLGITEFVYIGHSLGGYIGLAYAEKYSSFLKGLCLFHSTAYADSEERKTNRDKTVAFIHKYGADLFTQSFIEPLFLLQNRQLFKNEIAELKAIAKQASEQGIIATTMAMRDRQDRAHILQAIKFPVLLIGGRNDATIPINKLKELADLSPMIALAEIDVCGHMGMYEQKEKTLEAIEKFAASIY